jgi:DNA-binding CsgD family transcriptional regulator
MRIRAILRLKNDHLYQARVSRGYDTVASFGRGLFEFSRQFPFVKWTNAEYLSSLLRSYESFVSYPKVGSTVSVLLEEFLCLPHAMLFPQEYCDAVDRRMRTKFEAVKEVPLLPYGSDLLLEDVANSYERKDTSAIIKRVVSSELSDKELCVLRHRFGLDGEEEKSLKDVGYLLGVTSERVRQLELRALRKLGSNREMWGLR